VVESKTLPSGTNFKLVRVCIPFLHGNCTVHKCKCAHVSQEVFDRAIKRKNSAFGVRDGGKAVVSSRDRSQKEDELDGSLQEADNEVAKLTCSLSRVSFKGKCRQKSSSASEHDFVCCGGGGGSAVHSTKPNEVSCIIVDSGNLTLGHGNVNALHTIGLEGLHESPNTKKHVFGNVSHDKRMKEWERNGYHSTITPSRSGQDDALVASTIVKYGMKINQRIVIFTSDGAENGTLLSIIEAVQMALRNGNFVRIVGYNVSRKFFELQKTYPLLLEIRVITSDQVRLVARELEGKPVVRKDVLESAMANLSLGSARNVKLSVDLASCCSVQFAGSASLSSSFASAKRTPLVFALKGKRTNSESVPRKCSGNPMDSCKKHQREERSFDQCDNCNPNPKRLCSRTETVVECSRTEPVVEPTLIFVSTKTAKQLQRERLAHLKETNPRLYKALTKKD
jgi:hypothetical protein